jgi:hypothetical protein
MLIDNLACAKTAKGRRLSASVTWEEHDFPREELSFEFSAATPPGSREEDRDSAWLVAGDDIDADAFLAACFPLAAVHGEARVRAAGRACPMLIEGLRTAHCWWSLWGGMSRPEPKIETAGRARTGSGDRRHAIGFLSGGVDGLHTLMRNHQLYRRNDPAYISEVLFIHGFDIGKRRRDPQTAHYEAALRRLEPVAAEAGVRLIACRTNLRHLPTRPNFWEGRHMGAGLAAVAHAATFGPAYAFVGGSYSLHVPVPWGSHFAVDGLFSSQRVAVIHDGSRFTRLDKVRDLSAWPAALDVLRCCPAPTDAGGNCGRCEKCMRTRLELLAVGVEETNALGASCPPLALWDEIPASGVYERITFYEDVLPLLRERGYASLCHVIEQKIAEHERHARRPSTSGANGSAEIALDLDLFSGQDDRVGVAP